MIIRTNKKINLYISEYLRIISTVFILYFLIVKKFIKLLLIMLTDTFDCGLPGYIFGKNNWINCSEYTYQKWDKITDTICYTLLLVYILKKGNLSKKKKKLY